MKRLVVSAFWLFPPAAFGKKRVKALIEEHNLAINALHAVNAAVTYEGGVPSDIRLQDIEEALETYVYHFNKLRSI